MITNLKALVVVLGIAAAVFHALKPTVLRFCDAADFARRRNVWFGLTIAGFLSPSFWIYAVVAAPVMLWAGKKDSNPISLFLLLCFVVPPDTFDVPGVFAFDNLRLLSLFLLLPAAIRFRGRPEERRQPKWALVSFCLVGFWILETLVFLPPDLPDHTILADSVTNVLRRALLFFLDGYVVFWVTLRTLVTRRAIQETLVVFCLNCCVLATLACFETVRHWLLFTSITFDWASVSTEYNMRGGALRALVSSGGPLSLGYMLAIAFGFWQYLKIGEPSRLRSIGVDIVLWLGLLASYARGPWLGAFAIYVFYLALSPGAFKSILKAVILGGALVALVLSLPIGTRILQGLPMFGGSVNTDTIDYRSRLLHRSIELILDSPFFGDQLAFLKMEDLRQGQGIIDLTNTYLQVALDYGLIGLALFSGVLIFATAKTWRLSRRLVRSDRDDGMLGICLVACGLGTIFMLADNSFMLAYEMFYFVLAGLMGAYVNAARSIPVAASNAARAPSGGLKPRAAGRPGSNAA
jgi:hypothetical protein